MPQIDTLLGGVGAGAGVAGGESVALPPPQPAGIEAMMRSTKPARFTAS